MFGHYRKIIYVAGHDQGRVDHCRSCPIYQGKSKYKPPKAPAIVMPILSEPFEQVAIDLVGPFPKAKEGYMYLLTYMYMATRWPEAIPLRKVTAKSVAEALWSIFSRTSIPEVLLSDQGPQFESRLLKELCTLVGVQKVRSSPYHPQTNRQVERMHRTFKAVLSN